MNMIYDQFERYVQDNILHYLSGELQNSTIIIENCFLDITHEQTKLNVRFDFQELYKHYLNGKSVEDICDKIARKYTYATKIKPSLKAIEDMEYEKIKHFVVLNLGDLKAIQSRSETEPYIKMGDFAVSFDIIGQSDKGKENHVPVSKEMLEKIELPLEKLYELAVKNMEQMYPVRTVRIEDFKKDIPQGIQQLLQFVEGRILTNTSDDRGATVLLYPELLKSIREKTGRDLYIVPLSHRYIMLVPKDGLLNARALGKLLKKVNKKNPKKEDVLSDHIYEFDFGKNELKIINDSLMRRREMER